MLKAFSEGISTGRDKIDSTLVELTLEQFQKITAKTHAVQVLEQIADGKPFFGYGKNRVWITKDIFRKAQAKVVGALKAGPKAVLGLQPGIPYNVQEKRLKKLLTVRYPTISKPAIKSTATKLAKHLISKEGLKASAKTVAKIAGKFLKVLSTPYLWPLIWSPEINDIATSKDVQKIWKNMKSEEWWKEAKKRDIEARKRVKAGKKPFSEPSPSIPQGEYYHKDKGWY